jgi:hypothetical protein
LHFGVGAGDGRHVHWLEADSASPAVV